tara:strand:+ start:457 stop:993 length:537 start_codon:yes stop_codon:yes gene_type:complete
MKSIKYRNFIIQILVVLAFIFAWHYLWKFLSINSMVMGTIAFIAIILWIFFGINAIVTHYVDAYKIGGIENLKYELVMGLTILYAFGLFVLFFVGISNESEIQIYLSLIGAALGLLRGYFINNRFSIKKLLKILLFAIGGFASSFLLIKLLFINPFLVLVGYVLWLIISSIVFRNEIK